MFAILRGALLAVVLGGCVDDCSCGSEEASAPEGPSQVAGATPAPSGPLKPNAVPPGVFKPAADSPEQQRLTEVQKSLIETPTTYGPPVAAKELNRVVPDELGGFEAAAEAAEGMSEMFGKPVRTLSRSYADGNRRAYVKVTDTSSAPELRGPFAQKLTLVGDDSAGGQKGLFVGGHPALLAHYPEHASSSLTMLVAGRFLVDVRVKGASGPDDAQRLAEKLDFGDLAAGAGVAGQGG